MIQFFFRDSKVQTCKEVNQRLKTEVAFVFRSVQKRALIERQFAGHVRHSEDDMCQKAPLIDRGNRNDRC